MENALGFDGPGMAKKTVILTLFILACANATGICTKQGDCPWWEVCRSNWCEPVQACKSYFDCGMGMKCLRGACAPGDACGYQSDCGTYQACEKNACKTKKGFCGADSECGLNRECDLSAHHCVLREGYCDTGRDCNASWQECRDGRCAPKRGFCEHGNGCEFYQDCDERRHVCEPAPGYCENGTDCESGNCSEHLCMPMIQTDGEPIQIMFVLDDSGSMDGQKMEMAKTAAQVALTGINNRQTLFGLIDFDGCRPRQQVNFTDSRLPLRTAIANMRGRDATPIAKSLQAAYDAINQSSAESKRAFIILFTDGEDTCQGDPCAVVEQYKSRMDIPVYAIGYMIGAKGENQLRCVAEKSGGAYFNAPTEETVQETFRDLTEQLNKPCSSDEDCEGNYICRQNVCRPGKLHLVYVPVNMSADGEFRTEAERQHKFMAKSLPSLENCTDRIKMTALKERCDILPNSSKLSLIMQVQRCASEQLNQHGYDFFVGIAPANGLFDEQTAGYTFTGMKGAIARKGGEIVAAHEIGHWFGLNDEYCKGGPCNREPNRLSAEYGCDPDGGCCWKDGDLRPRLWPPEKWQVWTYCSKPYGQDCCEGNMNEKGGRSIMSWSDADGPRYHDVPSLAHLANNSRLRCDG